MGQCMSGSSKGENASGASADIADDPEKQAQARSRKRKESLAHIQHELGARQAPVLSSPEQRSRNNNNTNLRWSESVRRDSTQHPQTR